jgi:hypothetical protein
MLGSSWGATDGELALSLPCDDLLHNPSLRLHRAIGIDAPAAIAFAWLCQLKLAPYSYDLLNNFGRTSPRERVASVEELETGQRFMSIFLLASFATSQHITLRRRGVAVTYALLPIDSASTRLLVRVLLHTPLAALTGPALALGDLFMMRKQLLTLKALAERDATAARSRAP